jgi:hypothetical protein
LRISCREEKQSANQKGDLAGVNKKVLLEQSESSSENQVFTYELG